MAYEIKAWLDGDGSPRLEIIDADSGRVRIAWGADGRRSPVLKSLFHELMLLSVRSDLAGACSAASPPPSTARRKMDARRRRRLRYMS